IRSISAMDLIPCYTLFFYGGFMLQYFYHFLIGGVLCKIIYPIEIPISGHFIHPLDGVHTCTDRRKRTVHRILDGVYVGRSETEIFPGEPVELRIRLHMLHILLAAHADKCIKNTEMFEHRDDIGTPAARRHCHRYPVV